MSWNGSGQKYKNGKRLGGGSYGGGSCYFGGGGYNRGMPFGAGQYNFMGTGGGYKQFGSWKDRTGLYLLEVEQKERELAAQKAKEENGGKTPPNSEPEPPIIKKREEKVYDKNLGADGQAKVKKIQQKNMQKG